MAGGKKIEAGLREALAVARGEEEPARVYQGAGRRVQLDAATLDRIAREIGANIAADIERHYPGAMTERARGEVHRWFGPPECGAPDMDARLRASGAHRRHLSKLQTLAGTVEPGDAIEPIIEAMDDSRDQAALDYRAGGPVIEGEMDG